MTIHYIVKNIRNVVISPVHMPNLSLWLVFPSSPLTFSFGRTRLHTETWSPLPDFLLFSFSLFYPSDQGLRPPLERCVPVVAVYELFGEDQRLLFTDTLHEYLPLSPGAKSFFPPSNLTRQFSNSPPPLRFLLFFSSSQ